MDRVLPIYAGDDLVVLKRAQSPALLLEVGVIVNPREEGEEMLYSAAFHEGVAEAIIEAVLEVGKDK